MKLYYSPGACSLGIHVLLEETGKPYQTQRLDFSRKEQYGPEYVAINPKSKVPALQLDDGTVVTEWPAIAYYIAGSNPEAGLLPKDVEGQAKALEILDYLIATVHMRGFTRIFRPELFAPSPEDQDKVKQAGADIVADGFKLLEPQMAGKDYMLGAFSVADAALFFLETWAVKRAKMTLPAPFQAHLERMMARPAVGRVMAAEGLA